VTKLTKAQALILPHCPDWSAPYEVAARRWAGSSISNPTRAYILLIELHKLGMVEYEPANGTYRITEAGRAALKEEKSNQPQIPT
jgi:hypothetical protein